MTTQQVTNVNWNSGVEMNNVRCPRCGEECFNTWGLVEHLKHCTGNQATEPAPQMVIGFPDLTEAEMDAIFAQSKALDVEEDNEEYNWGWTAWEIGLCSDHLDGLALMGWLDAEELDAEARAQERQMFAQTVNGGL